MKRKLRVIRNLKQLKKGSNTSKKRNLTLSRFNWNELNNFRSPFIAPYTQIYFFSNRNWKSWSGKFRGHIIMGTVKGSIWLVIKTAWWVLRGPRAENNDYPHLRVSFKVMYACIIFWDIELIYTVRKMLGTFYNIYIYTKSLNYTLDTRFTNQVSIIRWLK